MGAKYWNEERAYHRNGVVRKVETEGYNTGHGVYLVSYRLSGKRILFDSFADHSCGSDCFNKPVPRSEVPKDDLAILGRPVDEVRKKFGNKFKYVEL